MVGRNDLCWCGSGKKWKKCHYPKLGGVPESLKELYAKKYEIYLKNDKQIQGIRKAGKLTAEILQATCKKAQAGITTQELNTFAHGLHLDAGARPAPLHYGDPPFPASICTSLNEVICHGIPNNKPLIEGDILNIDVSTHLHGYYGDCSMMVIIGNTDGERKKVVDTSYECLMASLETLKPGHPMSAIGEAIEAHAEKVGCSVVHQFVAHGCGVDLHENPQFIPHYRNNLDIPMAPGMTFTIEPMINAGVAEGQIDPINHWEARTCDGKPSAQWEYQVLITETGYEILTPWQR